MAEIQTVRGPIAADQLGVTLAHEHLYWLTAEILVEFPDLSWRGSRNDAISTVATTMTAAHDQGVRTIIDCTCIGGRDIRAMAEASERSGVNVVAATGLYTYDHVAPFYRLRPPKDDGSDIIRDLFVRDITVGIQGTDIRAGIIKAVSDKAGVTPNVDRILRAGARAHRETGVPITTHSDSSTRSGLEQQKLYREEGVDLGRIVIGHSGDSADFDYLQQLLDAGSFVGADRFGYYRAGEPGLEERLDTVVGLCERGYAGQILLAHDSSLYTDWYDDDSTIMPSTEQWVVTHLLDVVVPALRERGVTQHQLDAMLVDNPRRLLATNDPY